MTPEEIRELIHQMKEDWDIDGRFGRMLNRVTATGAPKAGIPTITVDEGKTISEKEANPVYEFVISNLPL